MIIVILILIMIHAHDYDDDYSMFPQSVGIYSTLDRTYSVYLRVRVVAQVINSNFSSSCRVVLLNREAILLYNM